MTRYLAQLTPHGEEFLMDNYPDTYGKFVGTTFVVHDTDYEGEYIYRDPELKEDCRFYNGCNIFPEEIQIPDEIEILEELDYDPNQEDIFP